MKLILFGASGRTGSHIARLAASRGHAVTAIVRPETSYTPPAGVQVVKGDVLDPEFVARAVPGHDVVVSALGIRYTHPWARRHSPDDFISRATANMVRAMTRGGVRRIAVISAAGVADSRPALNVMMRILLATSNVGVAYADLERVEDILRPSGLDWMAVRPTTLTNRTPGAPARITDRFTATASIPREAVAAYIVSELEKPEFSRRTPLITGG
ncbi:MAG TPA: NAD(P)H-binding protein [Vicinamibacterales bacterium]|nr:NAD(P)H-binding protein [Vicinamibacterales bacterium]